MPEINKSYQSKLLRRTVATTQRIYDIYQKAIEEITFTAARLTYRGQAFSLSQYPTLQKRVNKLIDQMHADIYTVVLNGIEESWDLANQKNDFIVSKRLAERTPSSRAKKLLYDPNLSSLSEFIKRSEKGLNLSDRVWNSLDPFPAELTKGLALGMSQGQSANAMARDLKQYLNNPDKLFRRVRNAEGKLRISKAARDFHPGQGVYRSSFKNARRLSATENNIAFRSSDFERWQTMPFVTGIEVHLSHSHHVDDMCDQLRGEYPKNFKFTGWHPHCTCFATTTMMSDAEYDKFEDAILAGKDPESAKLIDKIPSSARKWIDANSETIQGWKNKPYWVRDNETYLAELF